jgi:hypothetical protein
MILPTSSLPFLTTGSGLAAPTERIAA